MGGAVLPPCYLPEATLWWRWWDNGDLLQKVPCMHHYIRCPQPCSRPPAIHTSAGDPWTPMGKSGSVSCGVTAPFSWVLVHTSFCLYLQESVSQSCVSSGGSMVGLMATSSKRAYVIPKSAAPRAPAPAAVHCWPEPSQETLKGFNSMWTMNFQMFRLDLEKTEEPEIKLPTSTGSSKKRESSRKTSTSALLIMPKPLTGWTTTNCGKFLKRWEYWTTWPASWEIRMQVRKQQLELDMEQTGSK